MESTDIKTEEVEGYLAEFDVFEVVGSAGFSKDGKTVISEDGQRKIGFVFYDPDKKQISIELDKQYVVFKNASTEKLKNLLV